MLSCYPQPILTTRKKYERIAKRRGKKRAIIAIARMMLTAIYHMLSNGEIWNPCDLYKLDMGDGNSISVVKFFGKLLLDRVAVRVNFHVYSSVE